MRYRFLPLALLTVAASCGGSKPTTTKPAPIADEPAAGSAAVTAPPSGPTAPPAPPMPLSNTTLAALGLDPSALDKSVDPCTDFYQFACGSWIKNAKIPDDKRVVGRSFDDISDRNKAWEKTLFDKLATDAKTPDEKKLAAYYGGCMDEAAIAKVGMAPFKGLFALADSVKDARSLSAAVGKLHAQGIPVLFALDASQDAGDATKEIADLDQGGLGLPDRDYYLNGDPATKKVHDAYVEYIGNMMVALGHKPEVATAEAASIDALETAMAKVSADNVTRRDPQAMYNKIDKKGVAAKMPHFDWTAFWSAIGLAKITAVNAYVPAFLAGVDQLLVTTKPDVWRSYLTFHIANAIADLGPKALDDTRFKYRSALSGQVVQQPRWKRCAADTEANIGDLLGALFVRDNFPGNSKTAAEQQVAAITAAMKANIATLPWMDAATKQKALEKLTAMAFQIGFPKKWRNYTFAIDAKQWGASSLAAAKFERARRLAKIGKPVDRDDWGMTVPQVNAYYDPQLNGMVFPAGILQPPFYDVKAAVQVNLGGMGVVVGHELTHGFDDQGAQFDAVGNLKNWWEKSTQDQFGARTSCVVDQYNAYPSIGDAHVNGKLTLGENIADIGGVKLALTAYRTLRAGAGEAQIADGYTEDQQFFLGYGQAWCEKMRPQYEQMLVNTDPHSPARWRINGALSATPDFGKAWGCKAGSKMVPAKQCVVW